jgi:hypothetical protein
MSRLDHEFSETHLLPGRSNSSPCRASDALSFGRVAGGVADATSGGDGACGLVEVIEELEPTIGLEPMTCRLRSADEGNPSATQTTPDEVMSRNSGEPPDGPDRPEAESFVSLGSQLVANQGPVRIFQWVSSKAANLHPGSGHLIRQEARGGTRRMQPVIDDLSDRAPRTLVSGQIHGFESPTGFTTCC